MDIKEWLPEFQVAAESDDDLMKYFVSTKYVSEILDSNKWIVLGRKGTGKTAIYRYFESNLYQKDKKLTVSLNFRDYPWPIHKLYKETMEGELTAYSKSWEYIIVLKSLIRLIEYYEDHGMLPKKLKKAKKIIKQIYNSPKPTIIEIIKAKLIGLKKISGPNLSSRNISFNTLDLSIEDIASDQVLINHLKSNAFELTNYFSNLLKDNLSDIEIIVVMDQLDENWLEDQIDEYSKILVNLVNVCKTFNSKSYIGKTFKVIPFLRTDIFETLKFNDKNKIRQSSAVEIRWNSETLLEMLKSRVNTFKPTGLVLADDTYIFEVKNVRHGATPFRHILRRTFYRPRDILVYFNKIRDCHNASKSGLYSSKDLYKAEKEYSVSMYDELIDEWGNQKTEIFEYLTVLQNIGTQTFNYNEFVKKFKKGVEKVERSTVQTALQFLFQNSIIGQKTNANWEYVAVNPHMQIDHKKDFHVNNGLKTRLTLTESRTARK